MKLTVLVDNNAGKGQGEWGWSCLIEDGDARILLDVGASDLFLYNARKLGVDAIDVDYLVLSHGHWDHTWGLSTFVKESIMQSRKTQTAIVAHPLAFVRRYNDKGLEKGPLLSESNLEGRCKLQLTKEPLWLTNNLVWLGEIQRKHSFENAEPMGTMVVNGCQQTDTIPDDSALAYKTSEGLVIITGCSHSGICNILEQAMAVCGEDRIIDIIGGLHLLNAEAERVQRTVDFIKELHPHKIHAGHCTGFAAKAALSRVIDFEDTEVGLTLEY